MFINSKRLTLARLASCGCILFTVLINLSSAFAASNPFETAPSLRGYAKEAAQAIQSKEPEYLKVAQINEKEMEDIYQYLRDQIDKPLDIWKLVLLDYPRLRLLRNEIYARHGRVFTSEDLDNYFRSFAWYKPNSEYADSSLSEIEQSNLSVLKRIEYLKFHRNEEFIKKVEMSKKGLKDFTGDNEWIKVTKKEIIFKESGIKIPSVSAKERNTKAHVFFEPNIPLVAINYWDIIVSPGVDDYTFDEGADIYDIKGRKLNSFPKGSVGFYSPDIKAFILSAGSGGCFDGEPGTVSEIIFNAEGKELFSADYRDCGYGMEYLIPLWGKNLLALIAEEESKKKNISGRIVVFGENGEPISNVKINTEKYSLPMTGSDQQRLTQLVLVAPDLLYAYSKDSTEQNLVFLKKSLPFNPQVGKMYAYRPATASTNGIDCQKQKHAELITPIYNPAVLWENEFPSEIEPIITPKCIILTFSTNKATSPKETTYIEGESYESFISRETKNYQSETNAAADIIAFDKLTGRQIWSYRVPAKVQAIEYKDNLLAVKYYSGLSLVQIDSGRPLWNIKTTNSLVELPMLKYNNNYEFQLFIGEKKILVGYYGILGSPPGEPALPAAVPGAPVKLVETINFYDIEKGKFLESKDLLKLSKLFSSGRWENYLRWFSSADKIFIPLRHTRLNNGNLLDNSNLLAINFDATLCWIYETPAEIQQYTKGNPAPACLKYSMNNCHVNIRDSQGCYNGYIDAYKINKYAINLDPATGKQVDTDNLQQVPVPPFWSTKLLNEHKKQRNKEDVNLKNIKQRNTEAGKNKPNKSVTIAEPKIWVAPAAVARDYVWPGSCAPTALSDSVVYAMDRYNRSTVELYDACLTKSAGEDDGEKNIFKRNHYWTFPVSGGVCFIDHNFIIVKIQRDNNYFSYMAIGEKALKDYIWRKDGQIYVNIQKEIQAEQQQSNATKGKKNKKH